MLIQALKSALHRLRRRHASAGVVCAPVVEHLEPRLLLSGTNFLVTSLADNTIEDGQLTLREAIIAANTNTPLNGDTLAGSASETDQITFDLSLFSGGQATLHLNGTQLEITDSLTITGPQYNFGNPTPANPGTNPYLSINAGYQSRIFQITGSDTAVTLISLHLTRGLSVDSTGSDPDARKGGAIFNGGGATLVVNQTVMTSNTADSFGGGIYNQDNGTLTVNHSLIAGNHAGEGGAFYNDENATATLINTRIIGNRATYSGGGLFNNDDAILTLYSSAVTHNTAGDGGGGIRDRADLTINNSIVALNTANVDADIRGSSTRNSSLIGVDPLFTLNPSGGADGFGDDSATTSIDESVNDDYGSLRLRSDSPGLNLGDNTYLPPDTYDLDQDGDTVEPLAIDATGAPRIIGNTIEVGPHEYHLPADFNFDNTVDLVDLAILATHFGQTDPGTPGTTPGAITFTQGDANYDGTVDLQDLAVLANYFGQSGPETEVSIPYQEVTAEGYYDLHVQGVGVDDEAIYWSFTNEIVKTDLEGGVIASVEVPNHHGDLTIHDGKLYVAVNFGQFNDPNGNANNYVYVYNTDDLSYVTRYSISEPIYGAGGIAYNDSSFYVVGGLAPGVETNSVYEYDLNFNHIQTHTIDSGYTDRGIQAATFSEGKWYFGSYGSTLLITDDQFNLIGRYSFNAAVGIAALPNDQFFIVRSSLETAGYTGRVRFAEPHPVTGLAFVN